jgi:putative flippase GtrA
VRDRLPRQFLLFATVGAAGTGAHYSVLIALVQTQLAGPKAATTAGFVVGALVNYILNYCFTFKSDKRHSEALPKFLAVAASGAVLNYAIMWLGVEALHIHYLAAQLTATALILVWTYSINRVWTFAGRLARSSAGE